MQQIIQGIFNNEHDKQDRYVLLIEERNLNA